MQKHLCGLYFNPNTLEKKMITTLNNPECLKRLLKCRDIMVHELDSDTAIIMIDYEAVPEQQSPLHTYVYYKDISVEVIGSFFIINIEKNKNRISLNLFKQNHIRISHVTDGNLIKTICEENKIYYSVIITDTATGNDMTRIDFREDNPLRLIEKLRKPSFKMKGRFEYKLMCFNYRTGINIIPSVFSETINELYDTESDLGFVLTFKK
jgi:hypothetical protein